MKSFHLSLSIALSCFLMLPACKESRNTAEKKKEQDAIAEFERSAREMRAEQARNFESEGGITNDPKHLDRMIEASKKLEAASSGDAAKTAKVLRMFMISVQKDMASLTQYQKGLEEAYDFSSLKTATDIDALSDKVRLYQKANSTVIEKIKTGWYENLRKNLKNENLSQRSIDDFMAGTTQGLDKKRPLLLTIRSTDNEICQAILTQHAILKENFGKWTWNTSTQAPEFEDDATLERFNAANQKIDSASERQLEAQQTLVNS